MANEENSICQSSTNDDNANLELDYRRILCDILCIQGEIELLSTTPLVYFLKQEHLGTLLEATLIEKTEMIRQRSSRCVYYADTIEKCKIGVLKLEEKLNALDSLIEAMEEMLVQTLMEEESYNQSRLMLKSKLSSNGKRQSFWKKIANMVATR